MPDVPAIRPESRRVRVFISSTFRDMQVEREELVKKVFPQLRKLCEQRGVEWGEVDLRWGITDEQKAEGKVLPICLAEIERCKPFFIGVLGERYGWVPDEIPPALLDDQHWLRDHPGQSVTALEILHGVLNNPTMADRSFFYFRDPRYLDTIPENQRNDYLEIPDPEEISQVGKEEAEKRSEKRRNQLKALKERIKRDIPPDRVHESYSHPREFGALVLRDLEGIINCLYPGEEHLDPLDRETRDHEAFAASRFGVYIRRQEYFDQLDGHVSGDGPPLIVLGESGSGKSALLANWARYFRNAHHEAPPLLLTHFVGATAESSDWASMLRRIMGELKRHFDIQQDMPEKADELRVAFANWLSMAGARGKVILIIDALNQLDDRDGAPELVWLPPVIPGNVRLILSTLPGKPLDELMKRGWPSLSVKPLTTEERRSLITDYLALYRKALAAERIDEILRAPQTANPLYLRALLEEIRLHGDHFTLPQRISHYLRAKTLNDLYQKILERYEQDYDQDRLGLVRDAMTSLWAARRGLSESELLDILGSGGSSLPRAFWSPLYLAAEQALVNRSGLLGFFHDYFRNAVHDRYLSGEQDERQAHRHVAAYFGNREQNRRTIEELPWQLMQAKEWELLHKILADLPSFQKIWESDEYDLKTYWAVLESSSPYQIVNTYKPISDNLAEYDRITVWNLTILLTDTGHPYEAFSLRNALSELYLRQGDTENLQASLGNQGVILRTLGHLEEAMKFFQEQERICRKTGNRLGLQASLGNQGVILRTWGRPGEAMKFLQEQEAICRETGNRHGLQISIGNQALIHQDRGRLQDAITLHKEEERICRELGDRRSLKISLGNQAGILRTWGRLEEAMYIHKEAERISRELGDREGLGTSFGNQAAILHDLGRLGEAKELLEKKERICREIGDKDSLQESLGSQGMILQTWGRLEEAMDLLRDQEGICREIGNKNYLQKSLGNQASILRTWGRLEDAMARLKDKEKLCREIGNDDDLQAALADQIVILGSQDRLDEATVILKELEQISRQLQNQQFLQKSLAGQAIILINRDQLDGAMQILKEQEKICRNLGDTDSLQVSLGNQASVFRIWGQLDHSMTALDEQEKICRELGKSDQLQEILGNKALILKTTGQLEEAVELHKEREKICRQLGDKQHLILALVDQIMILAQLHDYHHASQLGDETCLLAHELKEYTIEEKVRRFLEYIHSLNTPVSPFLASTTFSYDGPWAASVSGNTVILWHTDEERELARIQAHEDDITACIFSNDGKRFVTGSKDKTLKILDTETAKPTFTLKGHADAVTSCAISHDGTKIASGSHDGSLKIWDAGNGKLLHSLDTIGPVNACGFSPAKNELAICHNSFIDTWDWIHGKEIRTVETTVEKILACRYSFDGGRIVFGTHEGNAFVNNAKAESPLIRLAGHAGPVLSCAFSMDGKYVVTGSEDMTLKVWEVETGKELITLRGHTGKVTACEFYPHGRSICSASTDGTIRVWDVASGDTKVIRRGPASRAP